jgi:hypothetical protein
VTHFEEAPLPLGRIEWFCSHREWYKNEERQ